MSSLAIPAQEVRLTAQRTSLAPRTIQEALDFSAYLAKSDLIPRDYQNKPHNIFVAVQYGMELGLPPMQALQGIAVINGRPSMWGDAVLAVVMVSVSVENRSGVPNPWVCEGRTAVSRRLHRSCPNREGREW